MIFTHLATSVFIILPVPTLDLKALEDTCFKQVAVLELRASLRGNYHKILIISCQR